MRLSDISSSSLEDRRGYLTIAVTSKREGKLLLRRTEGIKGIITTRLEYIIDLAALLRLKSIKNKYGKQKIQFIDIFNSVII